MATVWRAEGGDGRLRERARRERAGGMRTTGRPGTSAIGAPRARRRATDEKTAARCSHRCQPPTGTGRGWRIPRRAARGGGRGRARRHARGRAPSAFATFTGAAARGCRRARVKRFSRRRAHDASAVMPHTSWGARWPPLHAVHGGEGYDGESEMSDTAFLKRKRDDAKDALRARGEPFARHSRCKHRGCVSKSAQNAKARSRDARARMATSTPSAENRPRRDARYR